jgi:hypothetical protein
MLIFFFKNRHRPELAWPVGMCNSVKKGVEKGGVSGGQQRKNGNECGSCAY